MPQQGFPDGSVGKESACNAGDKGDMASISGSGRSPGEGSGNPLQYSGLENHRDRKQISGCQWLGGKGLGKTAKDCGVF